MIKNNFFTLIGIVLQLEKNISEKLVKILQNWPFFCKFVKFKLHRASHEDSF